MTGGVLRTVGIDVSLTSTGVARLQVDRTTEATASFTGLVTSDPTDGFVQRWRRFDRLADDVTAMVWSGDPATKPDLVMIEQPTYAARSTGSAHDRAGTWWMIVDRLMAAALTVVEVHNSHPKIIATGNGRADKAAVIKGVTHWWGDYFDLAIGKGGDDIADAVALAVLAADVLGHRLVELPEKQSRAVELTAPQVPPWLRGRTFNPKPLRKKGLKNAKS